MTVFPATFSVPVREDVAVFAATRYETLPLPVPDEPLVIVIQLASLVAVHAHPFPVLTETVPLPPLADIC